MTSVLVEEVDCGTAVVGRISLDSASSDIRSGSGGQTRFCLWNFQCGFRLFWFLGSLLMGILYDFSLPALIVSSMALQLIWIAVLLSVRK